MMMMMMMMTMMTMMMMMMMMMMIKYGIRHVETMLIYYHFDRSFDATLLTSIAGVIIVTL